jgi:hypothetical protein
MSYNDKTPLSSTFLPDLLDKASAGVINDNSKRSISVRIKTSDFGRIKAIARRLKVREPDVFRFALKVGLTSVAPLYHSKSSKEDLLAMFAVRGAEIVEYFQLSARRLGQILNPESQSTTEPWIDTADLELIAMSHLPAYMLVPRLQELAERSIDADNVYAELRRYLTDKYFKTPVGGDAEPVA